VKRLALLLLVLVLPATASAEPNGRKLFVDGCSSCHGFGGRGIPGVAPDLHGAGAQAADFYLSTGRMPLDVSTGEQPLRGRPAYPPDEIRALVRYVASLGGPKIPQVHPERGDLSEGQHAFATYCAGCHQIMGQGGVVTGAVPPPLKNTTATQLAEAVRVGPYLMPAFDEHEIDQRSLDSIALYVQRVVQDPPDRGGWGIGNLGPFPEGIVSWLLAGGLLIGVCIVISRRSPS
jgi:ubiquinol-cytochrome c reductase cytochrome c subunit